LYFAIVPRLPVLIADIALSARGLAMKISDIMTRSVVSVREEATIFEAIRLMLQYKISGLVVVDEKDRLTGIVTEGDFLRRREFGTQKQRSRWIQFFVGSGTLAEEYVQSSGRRISEVMTRSVYSVTEDASLSEAVQMMEHHRVKRLPVVRDDKVIGIVSRANFLRIIGSVARENTTVPANDASIREKLIAELNAHKWSLPGLVNFTVQDGVVDYSGAIFDERTRAALIVAAENIPGVKAVSDHLAWVEPVSGIVISQDEGQGQLPKTS
jgi:CBS domain-containing protein